MRLKKVISLLLTLIMILSLSVDTFAAVLNMTSGKNEVIQVQTDTNQFFNVIFQEEEWKPNAEQVYVMHMGLSYDMWRHFGNMNI